MSKATQYDSLYDDRMLDNPTCAACGKEHTTVETLDVRVCNYTKKKGLFCDDVCFKWRYYPLENNPGRYNEWYFGKFS